MISTPAADPVDIPGLFDALSVIRPGAPTAVVPFSIPAPVVSLTDDIVAEACSPTLRLGTNSPLLCPVDIEPLVPIVLCRVTTEEIGKMVSVNSGDSIDTGVSLTGPAESVMIGTWEGSVLDRVSIHIGEDSIEEDSDIELVSTPESVTNDDDELELVHFE